MVYSVIIPTSKGCNVVDLCCHCCGHTHTHPHIQWYIIFKCDWSVKTCIISVRWEEHGKWHHTSPSQSLPSALMDLLDLMDFSLQGNQLYLNGMQSHSFARIPYSDFRLQWPTTVCQPHPLQIQCKLLNIYSVILSVSDNGLRALGCNRRTLWGFSGRKRRRSLVTIVTFFNLLSVISLSFYICSSKFNHDMAGWIF